TNPVHYALILSSANDVAMADGAKHAIAKVQLIDAEQKIPVANENIQLSIINSVTAELKEDNITTDASGFADIYVSNTVIELVPVSIGNNLTQPIVHYVQFTPEQTSRFTSSVIRNNATADGVDSNIVRFSLTNGSGVPYPNVQLQVDACAGAFSPTLITTNDKGEAEAPIRMMSLTQKSCAYSAKVSHATHFTVNGGVDFTPGTLNGACLDFTSSPSITENHTTTLFAWDQVNYQKNSTKTVSVYQKTYDYDIWVNSVFMPVRIQTRYRIVTPGEASIDYDGIMEKDNTLRPYISMGDALDVNAAKEQDLDKYPGPHGFLTLSHAGAVTSMTAGEFTPWTEPPFLPVSDFGMMDRSVILRYKAPSKASMYRSSETPWGEGVAYDAMKWRFASNEIVFPELEVQSRIQLKDGSFPCGVLTTVLKIPNGR
ncbi:Ig-like domain-containing protein, partial [Vibrio vulnificus]|nr:Ig-like domain-containing protein [Vibrio vulnificus]MCU8172975.1 Ig-like domain-containing protein [Vibrio vulnificus]